MVTDLEREIEMPSSVEAERSILGAVLLDNQAFFEAQEFGLDSADFWLDSHGRIWNRMADLMDAQRAVDTVTLCQALAAAKQIEQVGGWAFVSSLTDGLPRRPQVKEYIRIVKDKALLRRMMQIGSAAVARAADGSEAAAAIMADVNDQILSASALKVGHGQEVAEILPGEAVRFEQEASAGPGGTLGASLLTAEIDRVTSGLMEEELCILAGRPGSGKTEAALQIALANARRGLRVHIQSLEMRKRQLVRRLWRLIAQVPVSAMRDPRCLTPDQRQDVRMAQEELADMPIFIDDRHELTVSEFRSRAVLAARRWKADLILVDYAQLLLVPRARGIVEAAPKQAETLRHIARDYCRTVALAQIRRAPPQDLNRYPDIEDILGSSAFEQAAQVILMLHRTRHKKQYTGEDFCFLGKMRELQDLRAFGIQAEKWGAFRDRYAAPAGQQSNWQDERD